LRHKKRNQGFTAARMKLDYDIPIFPPRKLGVKHLGLARVKIIDPRRLWEAIENLAGIYRLGLTLTRRQFLKIDHLVSVSSTRRGQANISPFQRNLRSSAPNPASPKPLLGVAQRTIGPELSFRDNVKSMTFTTPSEGS